MDMFKPLRKWGGIEGADVIHFFQIHIAINKLFVTAVDHSGSIRCCKHMHAFLSPKCLKHNRLCTQWDLLPVWQCSSTDVKLVIEEMSVSQCTQQISNLRTTSHLQISSVLHNIPLSVLEKLVLAMQKNCGGQDLACDDCEEVAHKGGWGSSEVSYPFKWTEKDWTWNNFSSQALLSYQCQWRKSINMDADIGPHAHSY